MKQCYTGKVQGQSKLTSWRKLKLTHFVGCPSHQDVEALSCSVCPSVLPFVFVFADLALIYASARYTVCLKMDRESKYGIRVEQESFIL